MAPLLLPLEVHDHLLDFGDVQVQVILLGNYGVECGAVINKQQPQVVPFSAVQVGEGGVEDVIIGVPMRVTGKLKGVK